MKKPFAISHLVITLAEIFGWIVVLLGVGILITTGISGNGSGGMAFLAIYAALGFAIVTLVQMARAQISTAENTAELLALMKQQAATKDP